MRSLDGHEPRFGHQYVIRIRPDNGKKYCQACRYKANTAAWVERYATDPEFRARHNATALTSKRKKKSEAGSAIG